MDTMELVKAQEQEMIQMRRHIHQNPELSNQEFQTTKLIQESSPDSASKSLTSA